MRNTTLVFMLSLLVSGASVLAQEVQKSSSKTPPATGQPAAKETGPFYNQNKPFLADRHATKGLECAACHGEGEKKQPVKADKCLECHTSFQEVAEQTKDLKPNPHSNHLVESGDVECTSCHHGHKVSEIFCQSCHDNMKFEAKAAEAAK